MIWGIPYIDLPTNGVYPCNWSFPHSTRSSSDAWKCYHLCIQPSQWAASTLENTGRAESGLHQEIIRAQEEGKQRTCAIGKGALDATRVVDVCRCWVRRGMLVWQVISPTKNRSPHNPTFPSIGAVLSKKRGHIPRFCLLKILCSFGVVRFVADSPKLVMWQVVLPSQLGTPCGMGTSFGWGVPNSQVASSNLYCRLSGSLGIEKRRKQDRIQRKDWQLRLDGELAALGWPHCWVSVLLRHMVCSVQPSLAQLIWDGYSL